MQSKSSHTIIAEDEQVILASRLKASDETVLRDILIAFGPAIAFVLGQDYPSLAKCQADSDDILAESLLRLWLNRDVYDPKRTPLKRWFFIIAEHITIDKLKINWQKTRLMEATGCEESLGNVEDDNDEVVDEAAPMSQQQIDINFIVSNLGIIDQKIVKAHASSEEGEHWAANLAGEIGMKPGAIRVRLTRIHATIEKEMNRRGHNLKRSKRSTARTIPIENNSEEKRGGCFDG